MASCRVWQAFAVSWVCARSHKKEHREETGHGTGGNCGRGGRNKLLLRVIFQWRERRGGSPRFLQPRSKVTPGADIVGSLRGRCCCGTVKVSDVAWPSCSSLGPSLYYELQVGPLLLWSGSGATSTMAWSGSEATLVKNYFVQKEENCLRSHSLCCCTTLHFLHTTFRSILQLVLGQAANFVMSRRRE